MVGQMILLIQMGNIQRSQVSLPTPDRLPKIDVSSAMWKPLKEAFSSSSLIDFTNVEIVKYFCAKKSC